MKTEDNRSNRSNRSYVTAMFAAVLLTIAVLISVAAAQTVKRFTDYARLAQGNGDVGVLVLYDPNGTPTTKWIGFEELISYWTGSPALSTAYLSKAVYDVSADGHADGNDVPYGATWNGDVNAPSMNAVYDEMETRGKTTGDNWTGTHDFNNVTMTLPSRAKNQDRHFIFTIPDPNALYALDTQFCIDPNLDAAITITDVTVTCDAAPASEVQFDLKFADAFIGLANATKICSVTTSSGVAHVTSFDDATVPANKCPYLEWTAAPVDTITQVSIKVRWHYD